MNRGASDVPVVPLWCGRSRSRCRRGSGGSGSRKGRVREADQSLQASVSGAGWTFSVFPTKRVRGDRGRALLFEGFLNRRSLAWLSCLFEDFRDDLCVV
jgi:hypothetical protein